MDSGKQIGRAAAALATLALGALGCDLLQSAQADRVLAASMLATPSYDFTQAVLSSDAGFTTPDGGIAGIDAGLLKVSSSTTLEAFFGEAPKSSSSQPKGIAGAKVSLAYAGKTFPLSDKGAGNYELLSTDEPTFVYQEGAQYTLTVAADSKTYKASVTGPTQADSRIDELYQAVLRGVVIEIPSKQDLKLVREATDRVAITSVIPISLSSSSSLKPSYTDGPTQAADLLDLIVNDSKWKQKIITIPGAQAFPTGNTFYVVNVTAVDRNNPSDLTNLFTTSVFLAGIADFGLVKTK